MQYKGHSLQKQSVGVDMGMSEQKDSSFQMMEGKESMDFFDSGGLSCRLLYRTSGLDGSIHLLLQLIREIFPIIRLNIVSGSSDLRVFVPIADTLPNGLTRVREAGKGRKSYPIIAHGSDLSKPLLLNDLESFKREALKIDPSVTELPFYSHAALLRLPLFARGSFTFLINFWSNEKNSFKEEDIEPLSRLIAPLAEELAAAFTDIPIAVGEVQERLTGYERIRQCAGLAALRQGIEKVAPTRTTVLVTGETGSGKELVAEAIHELSGRSGGPLVRVNCGSIAPTLLESELFGYEKGAFTGAQSRRSGYFECANGGTLFLDEIGELPLTAQVQLLRVLDRKIIQRVGDPRAIPVDVRVVAATNRDLEEMVEKGTFRRDLYYRLSVYPLSIPPLRERKVDILPLVRHFIASKTQEMGTTMPPESGQAELDKLYGYDWPGNVRELEHEVERALIDSRSGSVMRPLVFGVKRKRRKPTSLFEELGWPTLAELERRYLEAVLEKTDGKLTGKGGASTLLGIHYTTLRAKMKR